MRSNLPAGDHFIGKHPAALKLGIGFRHNFVQPGRVHHGEALQPQHGEKLVVRGSSGYRPLSGQRDGALDARVYHDIAARQGGHGAGYGFNVSVGEVQGDGLTALDGRRVGTGRGLR